MRKLMTAILTMSILFIGCSKKAENFKIDEQNGIKVYSNTEIPNDPNAKLDLKKLFTVSSEAQTDSNACMKRPVSLTADKLDNIYILDVMSMSVKKFDSSGNFIKSIGRMGQGPGELFYPSIMFIDNDTLNLMSAGSRKISKFDLDGNFYSDKLITDQTQLQNTKISRDGQKIVSYVVKPIMKEGQQPDIDFALSVLEMGNLKEKSVLNSKILSVQDLMAGKIDFNDLVIPFIPGNDYVYISENSDNQYRILGYDYNGKKQIEIRKDFKMIRYENAEKEEYITEMKKMMQGTKELKVGNFKKPSLRYIPINTEDYWSIRMLTGMKIRMASILTYLRTVNS
ncbi:MAG: 6-bladed beta-propeller [Candidatus Delongbacteria bacterium]|nr:6-bladed beta-propeller [Candidatus Delongbacteria bacterium]